MNVTNGKIIRLLVDDEPFDVRYGRAARARARARPPRRRPAPRASSGFARRRRRPRPIDAPRLVRPARGRRDPLRGRAAGRPARVVVQSELVANEPAPASAATRARPRCSSRRSRRRSSSTTERASCSSTRRGAASCGWPRGWTTSSTAPRRTETSAESTPDVGRVTVAADLEPGERLRWSSSSPTAGRACARCRPCATRPSRRSPSPPHRLGGPARPDSAPTWTTSGSAPTSSSTATPSSSRRSASRSSTRSRPAPAPSSARSAPRA